MTTTPKRLKIEDLGDFSTEKPCDLSIAEEHDPADLLYIKTKRDGYILLSHSSMEYAHVFQPPNPKRRDYVEELIATRNGNLVWRWETQGVVWNLVKVPQFWFINPTLAFFQEDRKSKEYDYQPRSKWAIASVLTVPSFFSPSMKLQHEVALYQLKKRNPEMDLIVFVILNTPGGVADGRGVKREKYNAQEWNATNLPAAYEIKRRYESLGVRVFIKRKLPQREQDDQMYYQFDFQKLYVWNLRYEQVMYMDADMIVQGDVKYAFKSCKYFLCITPDPGTYGGYLNNGMFIIQPAEQYARKLIEYWWKPDPPFYRIALQDLLSYVYRRRWKPISELFNYQALKSGLAYKETDGAVLVHFKGCSKSRKETRDDIWNHKTCVLYRKQKEEYLASMKKKNESKKE